MRIGVSGLAVNNPAGLGRLSRTYLLALASAAPDAELHVYLRAPADLSLIRDECDRESQPLTERLIPHYPAPLCRWSVLRPAHRLLMEEWDLPRQFLPLKLDAYLGCDFTLPPQPMAPREAVVLPDLLPFTKPYAVSWQAGWLYRRGITRSIRRRAALLCISRATQSALALRFPDAIKQSRVIYPALSPRLMQLAGRAHTADHALQVQGSLHALVAPGPFVLAVGVQGPRKNTALLVQTYLEAVMKDEYRGSLVLVGGDGRFHTPPKQRRLALEAAGLTLNPMRSRPTEVYDLGHVTDSDLSHLYQAADLLVCLSTEEGFGFPVLEALAHHTPVLVTADSSMTEVATAGIVTTPLDREQCCQRLVSTLKALPVLRREVAALPLQRYSIERLGTELVAALKGSR